MSFLPPNQQRQSTENVALCAVLRPRAATDQYLLPTGPTAANPAHLLQRANGTDRQTDKKTVYAAVIITST